MCLHLRVTRLKLSSVALAIIGRSCDEEAFKSVRIHASIVAWSLARERHRRMNHAGPFGTAQMRTSLPSTRAKACAVFVLTVVSVVMIAWGRFIEGMGTAVLAN